jgi:ubiquinone/menaquinone biosynthesis C-methylase UbiE
MDASLHFEFARSAFEAGSTCLANAALKSAEFLGHDNPESDELARQIHKVMPDLEILDHNTYYRLYSLSQAIGEMSGGRRMSVLDVGGGTGLLASFLPDCDYFLVEPTVNGIQAETLPFEDETFDIVVCCHVLEHIEPDAREAFLDSLMRRARKGLILLNPFHQEGSREKQRLELIIDVMGADWAKEHLDCRLPSVDFITGYADSRSLDIKVSANGTMTTSLALEFTEHFAKAAHRQVSSAKLNRFLNTQIMHLMDSEACPVGYLVTLLKP